MSQDLDAIRRYNDNDLKWLEYCEHQRYLLEVAEKARGLRDGFVQPRPELFEDHAKHTEEAKESNALRSKTLLHHAQYPPSLADLESLSQILLINLLLDVPNCCYYVLLRCIARPIRDLIITTIVEDEQGTVTYLVLDRQYPEDEADTLIPSDGVIIVKEPFYTITNGGRRCILVDHPDDLELLLPTDPRIPSKWRQPVRTSKEYNIIGNIAFREGKPRKAIVNYSSALSLANTGADERSIRSNRTAANFQLLCYDSVLEDIVWIKRKVPLKEALLIRATNASYNLRRFDDSLHYLKKLKKTFPTSENLRDRFSRVLQRIKERTYGHYDFEAWGKIPPTASAPTMDVADYIGPIERRQTEDRGRGTFAKRAISPGELLLCEKAFACTFSHRDKKDRVIALLNAKSYVVDFEQDRMGFITDCVQKLLRNPSLRPKFLELHAGTHAGMSDGGIDDPKVLNTWKVERITQLNAFASMISSLQTHKWAIFLTAGGTIPPPPEMPSGSSIWQTGSFFNHSCKHNTEVSFVGDLMIARANRPIAMDEELHISYVPLESYAKRSDAIKHWGFTCECARCVEEAKETKELQEERTKLVKGITPIKDEVTKCLESLTEELIQKINDPQNPEDATEAMMWIQDLDSRIIKYYRQAIKIRETYKADPAIVPRFECSRVMVALTLFYHKQSRFHEVSSTACQALEDVGFVIDVQEYDLCVKRWGYVNDQTLIIWVFLWNAMKRTEQGGWEKAEEIAKTCYEMKIGERASFHYTYSILFEQVDKMGEDKDSSDSVGEGSKEEKERRRHLVEEAKSKLHAGAGRDKTV
ncbi:hypothetical protein MMC25_003620 [Agyrium rufum]|nr:hypothetical protein [Agyrium rufum]